MFASNWRCAATSDLVSGAKAGVREGSQGPDVAGASASGEEDAQRLLRAHHHDRALAASEHLAGGASKQMRPQPGDAM